MDITRLAALGIEAVTGSLIHNGRTVGRLLPSGEPLLYPEGEELVEAAKVEKPAPARKTKAEKPADTE